MIFHLSLPVDNLEECLEFYSSSFDAHITRVGTDRADLILFGARVTLRARAGGSQPTKAVRGMHFGAYVPADRWQLLHRRLTDQGRQLVQCTEAAASPTGYAKLVLLDPSGNAVEINGEPENRNTAGRTAAPKGGDNADR